MEKVIVNLNGMSAEQACKVGCAVWMALGKARTVVAVIDGCEIVHHAEVPAPAPDSDLYVCACLNDHIVVSARCVVGTPAHARAVKAARKFWPNHVIESLTIAELSERESAGKKIMSAEGLPSI